MRTLAGDSNKRSLPKLLFTGTTGQVGGDLRPLLSKMGTVLATDRSVLDLTNPEAIRECVRAWRPDVIVNAAAYTAVDRAENEPGLAEVMNAIAPRVFAEEAAKLGALLIHFSTDYVFDGQKASSYLETDSVNPLNVYGRTKAAGEAAITRTGCAYLILRTSWVYSLRGSNFLLTIMRLAREREELRIVDDQIGAPTSSQSIAEATAKVLGHYVSTGDCASGIYHLTAAGSCSWYKFATAILRSAAVEGSRLKKILPIPSSEYRTAATRPKNSRLDCSKLRRSFGIEMAHWEEELKALLHPEVAASAART